MADPYEEISSTNKPDTLMPDLVGQTTAGELEPDSNNSENTHLVSGFGDGKYTGQVPTDNKADIDLLSSETDDFAFGDIKQDSYVPIESDQQFEAPIPEAEGVNPSELLLAFGRSAAGSDSYSFSTAPLIQEPEDEDLKEEMDDATPIAEVKPDFFKNEATPPPSPPPSPEPLVSDPVESPPFPVASPADSTSSPPSSEDRPMKMPKVTTMGPTSKGASSRSTGCVPSCAWYRNISPQVWDLLLWRNPVTTGPVLGILLFTLISLTCCSIFSVTSYMLLLAVIVSLGARVVKFVLAKVHHGDESHPFKEVLETELAIDESDAEDCAHNLVQMLNKTMSMARDLILVKDFIASVKFGVVLYAATYIGAWFNGLTVLILAVVGAFTLPKVYEVNKVQIDNYVDIGVTKFHDAYEQLQAKVPFLKQKQQ